ncbi:MAG: cell division protein ZapA [Synergistales bacterium]|nr:cell division protein ZapA [Bacteroidales bacterium]MDY6394678.1 cell division protein ZapA [Bacteroidales bacterium]MDY6395796.1 cell division protein ZapA [Bacteroidales bacterium]MDY6402398.1 cell division protein ZapA [Bacteroidales bacterium]MDY6435192.1 cell division protein ZapA [Synergistales bacterium]
MEETKTITLRIVQRNYTVRVRKDEEDLFLRASNSIKESLQFYAQKTSHRDKQDLMAMVLLQAFVSNIKQDEKTKNLSSNADVEKAKELDLLLDQILTSNNVETKEEPVESIEENEIKEDAVADLSPSEKDAEIEISRTIDKSDESKELTLF